MEETTSEVGDVTVEDYPEPGDMVKVTAPEPCEVKVEEPTLSPVTSPWRRLPLNPGAPDHRHWMVSPEAMF